MRSQAKKLWSDEYKRKLVAPAAWHAHSEGLRSAGKSVATLNGSFDLLHAGHLQMVYEASQQADHLIVALNSDTSIQGYKGPDRPIIPLEYRLQMVAMLSCVDTVTWFDELDPLSFLQAVAPDVHVNGSEYGTECVEAPLLRSLGARLHIVERIPGLATSDIVERIRIGVGA